MSLGRFWTVLRYHSSVKTHLRPGIVAADRVKLKLILRGKRLGLSLQESQELIELYRPEGNNAQQLLALIESIRSKRRQLEHQLEDLQAMLEELDASEQRCREALQQEEHGVVQHVRGRGDDEHAPLLRRVAPPRQRRPQLDPVLGVLV